jgi:hypothetical protein
MKNGNEEGRVKGVLLGRVNGIFLSENKADIH